MDHRQDKSFGLDPNSYDATQVPASILINPGNTSYFNIPKLAGGYYTVQMDWKKDFHFNTTMKRKYYGLDLYLEHPFDGKWFGKIDYLLSRSYGNSEGQVRTDIGQTDVSATVDWDYAQVMDYANGALANDRRHQIKAYGSYQIAPEWMLSGNLAILSGGPRTCLGGYGPDQTNPGLGYDSVYHYCKGLPSSPGATRNPWTYNLSLGGEYRPSGLTRSWASTCSCTTCSIRRRSRRPMRDRPIAAICGLTACRPRVMFVSVPHTTSDDVKRRAN